MLHIARDDHTVTNDTSLIIRHIEIMDIEIMDIVIMATVVIILMVLDTHMVRVGIIVIVMVAMVIIAIIMASALDSVERRLALQYGTIDTKQKNPAGN